jgi:hypothetical protein
MKKLTKILQSLNRFAIGLICNNVYRNANNKDNCLMDFCKEK